jgi:DNA-binding transcriptional ArsR family regulator
VQDCLRGDTFSAMAQTRTSSRQLDERLAKALSHPLRQRILQRLNEGGVKSPNELSQELGDPLGNVSYHVRILRELDCVELVRTEQRRGALEHYYKATAQPWLNDKQWARLPAAFRRKTLGRTLSEILEAASVASEAGGFDDPEVTVARIPLELDEQGWRDLVKLLNDTLDTAVKIQSDSQGRQGKPGAEGTPVRTELGLLHFRRAADPASA